MLVSTILVLDSNDIKIKKTFDHIFNKIVIIIGKQLSVE